MRILALFAETAGSLQVDGCYLLLYFIWYDVLGYSNVSAPKNILSWTYLWICRHISYKLWNYDRQKNAVVSWLVTDLVIMIELLHFLELHVTVKGTIVIGLKLMVQF